LAKVFRRGFAATFALDIISRAFGAATVVVLIRGLPVSSYAYTTLFFTFAQLFGSAATSGVRTRYLREEAERLSRATVDDARGAFIDPLVKGTLLLVAIGLCVAPIAAAAGVGSDYAGGGTLTFYATVFAIGYAQVELSIAHFQARRRFVTAGVLSIVRAIALFGASLVVVIVSDQSAFAISFWFVASMLALGLLTAGRIVRASIRGSHHLRGLTWLNREEMWLSFYYVAAAGFAYVDVVVAATLLTDYQVATLGASLRYLSIALAAIPALGAVLRVRTAQADIVDSPADQEAMVLGWIRRGAFPTAFVVGAAALLAPVVIPLLDGGKYPESVETLQIFLVTAFSAYLTAPAANVLMAQRRYLVLASIYGVGLALNLIGDVAVARKFGVIGIAIVSSAVYVAIDAAMVLSSAMYALKFKRRALSQ
jgi:O-antigen/teichoic acid export membrane protein